MIETGGFGRRIKLDLTGYVNKGSGEQRHRERANFWYDRERQDSSETTQKTLHKSLPFCEVTVPFEDGLHKSQGLEDLSFHCEIKG